MLARRSFYRHPRAGWNRSGSATLAALRFGGCGAASQRAHSTACRHRFGISFPAKWRVIAVCVWLRPQDERTLTKIYDAMAVARSSDFGLRRKVNTRFRASTETAVSSVIA